jgi:hypothetical protein
VFPIDSEYAAAPIVYAIPNTTAPTTPRVKRGSL